MSERGVETTVPWDDQRLTDECVCTFSAYGDPATEGESVHYLRRCGGCQDTWWSHHCPHDGYQSACPWCGARAPQVGVGVVGHEAEEAILRSIRRIVGG